MKKILTVAAVAAMLPLTAVANGHNSDILTDNRNNTVVNTFGNCVRTKWDAGADKCTGQVTQSRKSLPSKKSRSYLVFFDFNRSSLSQDAQDILKDAHKDSKRKGGSVFEIIGHSDRSGSNAYNLGLSKKRALRVKDALVKLGASKGSIDSFAKGESDPLVQTADGAREPQNRRVELRFYYED